MGTQEIFIPVRKIQDISCERQLSLLVIAEKPLSGDKYKLFDSIRGLKYIDACNRSRFPYVDTYFTYVNDPNGKYSFTKDIIFSILEKHLVIQKKGETNFAIAFIGEAAVEAWNTDILNTLDTYKTAWIRKEDHKIKLYDAALDKSTLLINYTVLPENPTDSSEWATLLDECFVNAIHKAPHSQTTPEMIAYFRNVLDLYKEHSIESIILDSKINPNTRKTLYLKISDKYNRVEHWYYPNDELCKDDSQETKRLFASTLREVLTTIPVSGDRLNEVFEYYSYKNEIKLITAPTIEIVEEPEEKIALGNVTLDALRNPESHKSVFPAKPSEWVNGTPSEWYTKWRKDVLCNKEHPERSLDEKMTKAIINREGYDDNFKYEWIYDIEVFKEDWLFVAKSLDGQHVFKVWNDGDTLASWIRNKILIGFNNAAYDDVVIKHAMSYPYLADPSLTVKRYSDMLIMEERKPEYPKLKEVFSNIKIPNFLSWDINFHMPFDIRRNSLKKLTMSVLNRKNYDSNVPFDIDRALTATERIEVEKYCEMDVDNTLALFLPDPENPKRTFARDSYDIRWNLIVEYGMQAKTLINKSSSFAGKVLCGESAKPDIRNTFKMVNGKRQFYCIPELAMKELAGTPLLQFYLDHQDNPDYIHEKFELYMGGNDESHKYQFGFGGLHQALLNYGSQNLTNMDVASLYPSLLVQYGLMSRGASARPESYEKVYHTRLAAKKEGKKLLNEGLKLILNGAIGAMLSEFNPLFDTWSNSSICVHGQLLVFILAQRLFNAGLNIIQTNTDGIMIETKEGVDHMAIAEQWMKETRLVLEFDEIAILQQNNVNNYYCEFKNGKIKSKGFYLSNEKFGKATSKILCNIVTNKPLFTGVEPRDYVIFKRHSVGEIYDGITHTKLEGRSLAFVVGYPEDTRTQSYYSRSRNERQTVKKDEKGKPILDSLGKQILETVHSESKITGFTDHMLLVDDINTLTEAEVNKQEYVNFAKNLLDRIEDFGPYYNENFMKMEESALLQALNPLKDNTEEHPTKSGVVCQNFLFESDCLSREEQEEQIANVKDSLYRVVWSGNKSYHCVVRIDRPVTSLVYKKVWYYLQHKLKFYSADTQCAIPSKYTRVPNQVNPKTGNLQTLYSFDKNVLKLDEILADLPKISEEIKQPKEYTGKVTIEALQRHINRQDWSEGNRFAAVQKLSPKLIAQVSMDELVKMIPIPLEKDHKYVLRAKYSYYRKYIQPLEDEST